MTDRSIHRLGTMLFLILMLFVGIGLILFGRIKFEQPITLPMTTPDPSLVQTPEPIATTSASPTITPVIREVIRPRQTTQPIPSPQTQTQTQPQPMNQSTTVINQPGVTQPTSQPSPQPQPSPTPGLLDGIGGLIDRIL